MGLFIRLVLCILFSGFFLYGFVSKQNELLQLRLELPELMRELKQIEEGNRALEFEIEAFESPIHLMELLKKPEYGHLKHPFFEEIVVIE